MAKNDLQGSLDLLVLKTLSQRGKLHGYGIVLHIQRASDELLQVEEGSLYPALHRMEQSGWVSSEWALTETNRKAKYYRLTPAGRRQLQQSEQSFEHLVKGRARNAALCVRFHPLRGNRVRGSSLRDPERSGGRAGDGMDEANPEFVAAGEGGCRD